MIEFSVTELTLTLASVALFTSQIVSFRYKKKMQIKEKMIEDLEQNIEWEKLQNQMIISEVHNFKDASNDLRKKAIDLAIELGSQKVKMETGEFSHEIKPDLNQN